MNYDKRGLCDEEKCEGVQGCYMVCVFLWATSLFAPSIDTLQGPNFDKSMTITTLWLLDAE